MNARSATFEGSRYACGRYRKEPSHTGAKRNEWIPSIFSYDLSDGVEMRQFFPHFAPDNLADSLGGEPERYSRTMQEIEKLMEGFFREERQTGERTRGCVDSDREGYDLHALITGKEFHRGYVPVGKVMIIPCTGEGCGLSGEKGRLADAYHPFEGTLYTVRLTLEADPVKLSGKTSPVEHI